MDLNFLLSLKMLGTICKSVRAVTSMGKKKKKRRMHFSCTSFVFSTVPLQEDGSYFPCLTALFTEVRVFTIPDCRYFQENMMAILDGDTMGET